MALSHRLEMRQGQSLVMTPQLLQAIKLLQLSSLDLVAYVEAELERNPLLERAENENGESPAISDGEGPGEGTETVSGAGADWSSDDGTNENLPPELAGSDTADLEPAAGEWSGESAPPDNTEIEERFGAEIGDVFPDEATTKASSTASPSDDFGLSAGAGGAGIGSATGEDEPNLEAYVAAPISLHDHLLAQLGYVAQAPADLFIGREIIDGIDDAGYLRLDLGELAGRLGVPLGRVEAVLAMVHRFDPSGVGARSLVECLSLQLAEQNRLDPAMQALLSRLDLVAKRDLNALSKLCGVDLDDILDMLAELKALHPKPGLRFGGGVSQTVIPDVQVRAHPDGSWNVELNPAALPRVLVNQDYHARVSKGRLKEDDKSFIAECLQTANWLTRSLEQRARTVLKVATEIVRQQDAFLTLGVEHLRPLNLKSIAEAIAMHESTVSRVTSNKYMATPRGIFEMKYFFSSAIQSADGGEALSAQAVRFKIKQLVETESAEAVLSDDTIVQRLREGGVDIARRTVAKYRESMGIASSLERRRMKARA
jgi:RNA polymerase sigma-54 factor